MSRKVASLAEVGKLLLSCSPEPKPKRQFDIMSGGFIWSDEIPENTPTPIVWRLRPIFGHRAAVSLGNDTSDYEDDWRRLQELCPGWPGFIAERSSTKLRDDLNKEDSKWKRRLDKLDQACSK